MLSDAFKDALLSEDQLGRVVRAHLHVESHIDEILEKLVVDPDELARMKLDYAGKVSLICALGVSSNVKAAFNGLGSLRNKFAHNLSYELDPSSIRNLYESLPQEEKRRLNEAHDKTRKESPDYPQVEKFKKLSFEDQFVLLAIMIKGMATDILEELDERGV